MHKNRFLALVAALALGATVAAAETVAPISETTMTGLYSIIVKVLPAESFTGTNAAMTWDAGAPPVDLNSPLHPNHHLVAFVMLRSKPVEDANVAIRYREVQPRPSHWISLPVARMHDAGKRLDTTHYGNNVRLQPGSYEVEVTVDNSEPATVQFTLPAAH